MAEAIALAKASKDTYALAEALTLAAILGYLRRDPSEVERLASESIELSARHHFAALLDVGEGLRGWAHSLSGNTAEGLNRIECGIGNLRAMGWPNIEQKVRPNNSQGDRQCSGCFDISRIPANADKVLAVGLPPNLEQLRNRVVSS
jgi:hypothetical protein